MNEIMTPHQAPEGDSLAERGSRGAEDRSLSQPAADSSLYLKGSQARTAETVGAEIRSLTAAAKYVTLWYAVEIGRRLTEAKELVEHGQWLEWLKSETEFSQPTASRFMKLYTEYGADQIGLLGAETKYSTLNNLSISNALRLLAVPEEEREEFALQVDAEHISSRELEQALRERDEAIRRAEEERAQFEASEKLRAELADEIAGTRTEIEAANRKIRELESRPVEVAVSEPDPGEIERKAAELAEAMRADDKQEIGRLTQEAAAAKTEAEAAKSDAEAQIKKLKEKAKAEKEKLEARLKAAEERAETAGAGDKAEAETARAEAEELRKKLALSGEEITVFKLRFTAWQESFRAMQAALDKLPEEQREKCAAAVKKQAEAWCNG